MGEADEWEPPMGEEEAAEPQPEVVVPDPDAIRIRAGGGAAREEELEPDEVTEDAYEGVSEPEPDAYEEGLYYEGPGFDEQGDEQQVAEDEPDDHDDEETTVKTTTERDWLSEVSDPGGGETLEWPAPEHDRSEQAEWRQGAEDEEPLDTPRVRHLFPEPDETDWEIGELDYDRSRSRVV